MKKRPKTKDQRPKTKGKNEIRESQSYEGAKKNKGHILNDVLIGFLWAALLIAVLLFSGGGSNFIYVDF